MDRRLTALASTETDNVEKFLLCFETIMDKLTKQSLNTVGKSLSMMQRDGQNLM